MNEHTATTAIETVMGTADPSASIIPLYAALAQAQSEFATIPKNKVNPAFKSRYADLEAILQTVRPVLNRHGIFLYQTTQSDGVFVTVETVLLHASGAELRSGPLTVPVAGRTAQSVGSAITYGKRYSLSGFLGVSADDDDDGNAASEHPANSNQVRRTAAPEQKKAESTKPAPKTEAEWVEDFFAQISLADTKAQLDRIGAAIKDHGFNAEDRTKLVAAWKARAAEIAFGNQ